MFDFNFCAFTYATPVRAFGDITLKKFRFRAEILPLFLLFDSKINTQNVRVVPFEGSNAE